jgi:vanillate O-demethylase ferredoxin subunit
MEALMDRLRRVKVTARQELADGIAGYELAAVDGSTLPDFKAGAHIDLHIPGGLVRQYSLCELPGEQQRYRIGVLRDPQSRGGSARLLNEVREGDELAIGEPRNHFGLHDGDGHSILFAGGIGITPILCMAQQLTREGRPFEMHYCGRSLSRMAFVEQLRGSRYVDRVRIHVDDGPPEQQLDARSAIGAPAVDRHLYVCGPTGFMGHILATARALGWTEERLHREYFAAPALDHSADGPFELEIQGTGRVIPVAADQSAAQALLDAGVAIELSCEQGVCGTCITKVVEGIPDHRDLYFTDEEHARNDRFTPCCSRARTRRLVLEL